MSDLIFRGVKNPANCSECFFWSICPCLADFDDYSAILDSVHDGKLVRHEECPFVPLPEGHGRLIDADRLGVVLSKNFGWTAGANVMQQLIDAAPTIIEADGWKGR